MQKCESKCIIKFLTQASDTMTIRVFRLYFNNCYHQLQECEGMHTSALRDFNGTKLNRLYTPYTVKSKVWMSYKIASEVIQSDKFWWLLRQFCMIFILSILQCRYDDWSIYKNQGSVSFFGKLFHSLINERQNPKTTYSTGLTQLCFIIMVGWLDCVG